MPHPTPHSFCTLSHFSIFLSKAPSSPATAAVPTQASQHHVTKIKMPCARHCYEHVGCLGKPCRKSKCQEEFPSCCACVGQSTCTSTNQPAPMPGHALKSTRKERFQAKRNTQCCCDTNQLAFCSALHFVRLCVARSVNGSGSSLVLMLYNAHSLPSIIFLFPPISRTW